MHSASWFIFYLYFAQLTVYKYSYTAMCDFYNLVDVFVFCYVGSAVYDYMYAVHDMKIKVHLFLTVLTNDRLSKVRGR